MSTKNLMSISEVEIQLEKIRMYIEEEKKYLEKMKLKTGELFQTYHSSKYDKINAINKMNDISIDRVIEKRKQYLEIIQKKIDTYEISAIQTNDIFNNGSGGFYNG